MKRLFCLLLGLITMFLLGGQICSAANTVNISARAVVPTSSPEISVIIRKFTDANPDNNPWTNSTEVSSMDFGGLTHLLVGGDEAGVWYSQAGFCVVVYAQPYGDPYEIKSTCLGLSSGSNSLPAGCFGLTPVYSADDRWGGAGGETQGDMPAGAWLGDAGPAITTGKLIYSSETGVGTARIIQAYYGLPCYKTGGADPFPDYDPIPLNQAAGTYTGTVTITISQK